MKKFKLYDFWISTLLIASAVVYSVIKLDYTFLIGYCVVGSWQVISMIVHAINKWFNEKGSARNNYHTIVAIVLAAAALGFALQPLLMLVLCIMLFAAPFMAIFYTRLCYNEVYVKMQRPLALLK